MILGVGTDIIEIDRIELAVKRNESFLEKTFTAEEIQQLNLKNLRFESIAGNFAAKEAVSKALGTGIRGFGLKDIEVFRDELGKPFVRVSEKIENILNEKEFSFHLSISHNKSVAMAFVVLEEIKCT